MNRCTARPCNPHDGRHGRCGLGKTAVTRTRQKGKNEKGQTKKDVCSQFGTAETPNGVGSARRPLCVFAAAAAARQCPMLQTVLAASAKPAVPIEAAYVGRALSSGRSTAVTGSKSTALDGQQETARDTTGCRDVHSTMWCLKRTKWCNPKVENAI